MQRNRNGSHFSWVMAVNALASLILISLAMLLALLDKTTAMGIIVAAGALCIAFLNLDRFQSFKGAGFEAEMKRVVDEAYASIDEVRNIAVDMSEATLSALGSGLFISGMKLEQRVRLRNQLVESLRKLGADDEEIARATDIWRRCISILFYNRVKHVLGRRKERHRANPDIPPEVQAAATEFEGMFDSRTYTAPSSAEIRAFVDSKGLMDEKMETLLSEYARFEETGEIIVAHFEGFA